MSEKSSENVERVCAGQHTFTQSGPVRHPSWCDPDRCTADPASQANGHRSGDGEQQSAPITLDLPTVMGLPVREPATAWLTDACAPWSCHTFLRVQVSETELSMAADDARPALDALSALLALADTTEEVI